MTRKSQFSDELKNKIVNLYNEGLSTVKIAEILNSKASTIASVIKSKGVELRSNRQNSRKFKCNDNYFSKIDTENKAYWLGFIYADGYITQKENTNYFGISLSTKDRNHLEKLNNDLESTYNIHDYKVTGGYKIGAEYSRLLISSNTLVNNLKEQGVVLNKTLILNPPSLDGDLIKHFIRGYIDGDGSITVTGKKYSLKIVGTDDMLTFIKDFIETNTSSRIKHFYKRKENDAVSYISINGNIQLKTILDIIYGNSSIYLDRKYDRYLNLCKQNTVECIGNGAC